MTRKSAVYALPFSILLVRPAFAQPSPPLAILDTNVVDVVRGSVLSHQSVVTERGRITDIGPADTVRIPAQVVRIPG